MFAGADRNGRVSAGGDLIGQKCLRDGTELYRSACKRKWDCSRVSAGAYRIVQECLQE